MTNHLAPDSRRKNKTASAHQYAPSRRLFAPPRKRRSASPSASRFRTLAFCLAGILVAAAMLAGDAGRIGRYHPTASAQAVSTLNRPADPVVLTGANVPALIGVAPGEVVAFRSVGGVWEQIPVQVDERAAAVDFGTIYNSTPIGWAAPQYTDANTFTGPDSDPALDGDDEIVFMAKDAGGTPETSSEPPGVVAGSGVEVTITEPNDPARVGRVYLFRQTGTLNQGAGRQYVNYQFALDSGDYRTTYSTNNGPNPENSTATTAAYAHHFSDRWIDDEMRVFAGSANGADILDRHKNLFAPDNCLRSEDTFSSGGGAFVANKAGPVRAIRSYVGANSGPYTQREHIFYERRQDVTTFLRVHQIQAIMDFFDYSPAAGGMTYYNDLNQAGVTVDGNPDTVAAGQLRWELLDGPQGALSVVHTLTTDIPNLTYTSYYLDDTTPPDPQCTGDAYAYGSSGLFINQPIPCTSVKGNCGDTFIYSLSTKRTIYYEPPGLTVADAATRSDHVANPLQTTTQPWQAPTPTPTPTATPTPTPTATPTPAPLAPGNLAVVTVSAGQINLSWVDNSTNEDGFRVERCAGVDCASFVQIAEVAANVASSSDTGLTAGTTYRYRVRAFNGGGTSAYSNTAEATTTPAPPNAPSGLNAAAAASSQINLSWSDNSTGESGFKIERCQGSGCANFAQVAQVGANATSYNDAGLGASTSYTYRVRAFNGGGDSAYSNTSQAATPAPPSPPAAPSALKASTISKTQINLTWADNSGNEDGFKIERCAGSGCKNFAQVGQVGANVKSFSDAGLAANTMYVYRVRAFNGGGNSAYSANASAKTSR